MRPLFPLLGIFMLFIFSTNAFADKPPIKFGKIEMDELLMTSYELDTSAPAVILCDYGVWSLQDYKFRKTVRIKILKPEGLDYGNYVYPSEEGTTIRGFTYNLENGEIVKEKVKGESIFKERIYDDYYNWRIAMPNVKVGSVIDIEITFWGIPSIWYFQKDIPVKYSELIIPQSMYIDYRKNFFGFEPLFYSSATHWIAKDMPAFKSEPFINSSENYVTKYEFDVLSYHFPGYYREFTTDWNAVARRLNESYYFGGVLNNALYLNNVTKEIEDADSTEIGKMKLALKEAKKMKWNEEHTILSTSTNLGSEYRNGVGNSADINLVLVNLLNKLKIQAHPVVLSTRDNGVLPLFFPSLNKLNYVIAYAKINNVEYLLDATDEYSTIEILPERCLNQKGYVMSDDRSMQVSLDPKKKSIQTEMLTLNLDTNGKLTGKVDASYNDYSALNFRHYYSSFNSIDEMIDDMGEDDPNIFIDNYTVNNMDDLENPVQESYTIELKNQLQTIGNKMYLTPLLNYKTTDNPFKIEERKYPVSYPYCKQKKILINITLPEGYTVTELPQPLVMSLPNNAGKITYQVQFLNGKLTALYQFQINKTLFTTDEYALLREFYNQVVKKHAEPVVIEKI